MEKVQQASEWLARCNASWQAVRKALVLCILAIPLLGLVSSEEGQGLREVEASPAWAAPYAPIESSRGKPAAGYQALTGYLSHRYRIAADALEHLVDAAYVTGHKLGLDPVLILSVIAVESRFNPIAQSELGAKGLMQVMPQHHKARLAAFGGGNAVLEPAVNILIGAQILKDCIRRGGGVEAGLQLYAGAYGDPDNIYSQKVMAERGRLEQVIRRSQPQPARSAAVSGMAERPI